VPPDPSSPLKLLAAGRADLAISYEPEVLLARDRGLRVVSVGAVAQRPLTSIMALGSKGIRSPSDLAARPSAPPASPTSRLPEDDRAARGVAPSSSRKSNVGFNLCRRMLSGKVDATLGAFWNIEGVELARRGKHPSIIRMDQAGRAHVRRARPSSARQSVPQPRAGEP
jgi:putative hydroxymethylpyrimidine transport system substrate-binding protein